MNARPSSSAKIVAIGEGEPLPPEDLLDEMTRRSELDGLYRNRAALLIRHFSASIRDVETATDIVHEAFLRFASLSFPKRHSIARPDAYLYRICLNLFRDRGRKQAQAQEDWMEPFNHDGVRALESRDALRRLETIMLRLSPKTREIFLARRLDGMSYAEIAERTGLSIKGVEKHMTKAIATIDRMMHYG